MTRIYHKEKKEKKDADREGKVGLRTIKRHNMWGKEGEKSLYEKNIPAQRVKPISGS